MYNLMDSTQDILSSFYFVTIVIVGSFFLLNLILAVILDSFTQIQELEMLEQLGEGNKVDMGGAVEKDESVGIIKNMI